MPSGEPGILPADQLPVDTFIPFSVFITHTYYGKALEAPLQSDLLPKIVFLAWIKGLTHTLAPTPLVERVCDSGF